MLRKKKRKSKECYTVRTKFRKAFKGRIHGNATRSRKTKLWTIWTKGCAT